MIKYDKICIYLHKELNHKFILSYQKDRSLDSAWTEELLIICSTCNVNMTLFIADNLRVKYIKELTNSLILIDNIYFIINYKKGYSENVRDFLTIKNILSCDEQQIKNLLE